MKFIKKSKAQSLVEYALILALVTVIAITALQFWGKKVNTAVEGVGDDVQTTTENAAKTYCEGLGQGYSWNESTGKCESSNTDSGN